MKATIDAESFRDLVAGFDITKLCLWLNVSPRTLKRWKTGQATPPKAVIIALTLRLHGDLSALFGDDWQHFRFGHDGKLYIPGWKYGWEPGEIRALFFTKQELRYWKAEAGRLERELQRPREAAWAAAKVRRLVSGVSSFPTSTRERQHSPYHRKPASGQA